GEARPRAVPGGDRGLDPGPVAGEEDPARALVEDGEGEHPAQMPHAVRTVSLVRTEDHLRVRLRTESYAARLELAPQLAEIVDFAVEDDSDRAIIARHGLVAGDQIDDGQAPMTQPGRTPADDCLAVRPPMRLHRGHGAEEGPIDGTTAQIGNSGDT